jgi:riboflavin biosynthesis pyrimidine reductase
VTDQIIQLWPTPITPVPLQGLYLRAPLLPPDWTGRTFVYSNFVASTDGRIALPEAGSGLTKVPDTIANPRDWRLFQELAAQADLLLTSGGYLREFAAGLAQDSLPVSRQAPYADLFEWRQAQGLQPQPDVAVLSNSLEVTLPSTWFAEQRRVFVLTTADPASPAARRLQAAGAMVVPFAGTTVGGRAAVAFLEAQGYRRAYSIGGPHVLRTLLADDVLDALFLTTVHRLVGGGAGAPGILEGPVLDNPVDLRLSALYYDGDAHGGIGQTLARYDRRR